MNETRSIFPRIFRLAYLVFAVLFLIGIIVQVYLVGMTIVARQISWQNHIGLGHGLAAPLLFMLLSAYLGRFPRRIKLLTWLLVGIYVFQADVVIFMRATAPLVSAIHPVLALIDFALAISLVRSAWSSVKDTSPAQSVPSLLETPAD